MLSCKPSSIQPMKLSIVYSKPMILSNLFGLRIAAILSVNMPIVGTDYVTLQCSHTTIDN